MTGGCPIPFSHKTQSLVSISPDSIEWTLDVDVLTIELFFSETMSNSPAPTRSGLTATIDGGNQTIDTPLTVSGTSIEVKVQDVSPSPTTVGLKYDGSQANFKSVSGKPVWAFNDQNIVEGG